MNRSTLEWLNRATNSLQAILGRVILAADEREITSALDAIVTPRTPFETLLLRGLVQGTIEKIVLRLNRRADFCGTSNLGLAALVSGEARIALREACLIAFRHNVLNNGVPDHIVDYLNSHYRECVTMTSVAHELRIQPQTLNRVLRGSTGMTFKGYVTSRRIRDALELIRNGTKVEAAALSVGYRSKSSFYRVCKRHTGLSPARVAQRSLGIAT